MIETILIMLLIITLLHVKKYQKKAFLRNKKSIQTDDSSTPFGNRPKPEVVSLNAIINKSCWTLLGYLCLAIGKYGKPKKLRTDDESIFTSFVFRTFLNLVNIQHQRIPTASPWCNGRIERFFGTLKPMIQWFEIENKAELQCWLHQFRYWYNYHRTHQNLNGKTPEDPKKY